ncbi:MAG: tRNA uridine-5-carboxymethylaminomethyl(34) synthesis GTPase MnmE [Bacilli bacterium]
MEDTIVAIATSAGIGAINIIRLSGSNTFSIVSKVCDKDVDSFVSNSINYCHIIFNNEVIDEVLISVFRGPKSYTKEDIIEINTHGGYAATNKVLAVLLENGARMAQPGEFIKRAFLNGRIDLTQAEAVGDIINANTENARKVGVAGLTGKISKLVNDLKSDIIKINSNIQVNIDYPEYEDEVQVTNTMLKEKISCMKKQLFEIINNSKNVLITKNGINVAIIGSPNVGKSSLLNNLIGENKAIVTDIAGTTRDIVEGKIIVEGIEINLIDTAGIRDTDDKVEKIGVSKSYEVLSKANLVLMVIDINTKISAFEKNILEKIDREKSIIVLNKSDLKNNCDYDFSLYNTVETTAISQNGTHKLVEKIKDMFKFDKLKVNDYSYVSNARQEAIINQAYNMILDIEKSVNNNVPVDLIEIDLQVLWEKLSEITGEVYQIELLDNIFKNFCLGK